MVTKRRETIPLTFSKHNQDVKKILDDKKSSDFDFVTTDYLCKAVRFYEKYKDVPQIAGAQSVVDVDFMKKLIEEKIREMGTVVAVDEKAIDIDPEILENRKLEEGLDEIPIEDD